MSRVKRINDGAGNLWGWQFHCPGCDDEHVVGTSWTFNGSVDLPTFAPSVLVRSGHEARDPAVPGKCWCDVDQRYPDRDWGHDHRYRCMRCHSFVRDGRIQFLADCTHALAGQTVDLPEIEAEDAP